MKEQTKTLLTVKEKETVKNMGRVADYIGNIIEKGDIALEEKIIACNKSVEDCWKYITAKAREEAINGCRVIDDETVFGWAVHFYDENGEPEDMPKSKRYTPAPKSEKAKGKKNYEKAAKPNNKSDEKESLNSVVKENVEFDEITLDNLVSEEEKAVTAKDTQTVYPEVNSEIISQNIQEENTAAEDADADVGEKETSFIEFPTCTPEKTHGENLKCIICGKKLSEAFSDKPVENVRKWAERWLNQYGRVFCCKAHKEQFLRKVEVA